MADESLGLENLRLLLLVVLVASQTSWQRGDWALS